MKQNFTAPLSLVCLFGVLLEFNPASAQVTPDGTTSTTVNVEGNNFEINDGDRAGGNLFHSFRDFTLPNGESASFNNALDISNILSRVTGGNISDINGLIEANGSANLFLINPAGIIFGQGARLNIGGSFLGSTADSILFSEGEFSAVDLDNPPLLTINAPIGLGFRDEPAPITKSDSNFAFLTVPAGANFTLVGGDLNFETIEVTAPGGRVDLGGLSEAGIVTINENGSLSFPDGIARADVTLTNATEVNVRGADGGSITVNARNIQLSDRSSLLAGIEEDLGSSTAQAGDITINATDNLSLTNFAFVNVRAGDGGTITVNARNVELSAGEIGGSFIEAGIEEDSGSSTAQAGDITINATDNISLDESEISNIVESLGQGQGGDINITANSISLINGSQLISDINPEGKGNAGNIMINATESISFSGVNSDGNSSGIFARVQQEGTGMGGDVELETETLTLSEGNQQFGTQIVTENQGEGGAGNITIDASNILIDGFESGIRSAVVSTEMGNPGNIYIKKTNSLSLTNGAFLNTNTDGRADAGTVEIDAKEVTVSGGSEIRSETTGQGNGGNIIINASDRVSVDGSGSAIFARSLDDAEGNGGNINITTDSLSVTDRAQVDVSSNTTGSGGNIEVKANSIELDRGTLQAATAFGQGGNIQLQIDDNLTLRNNSTISARAFEAANGGNINIDAKFIIAFPNQNNDILASAGEEGMGGRITLDAESVFGIQERPQSDRTNDIDASGGVDGEVIINTPNVDITQGLVKTPQNVVEPEQTTAQACQSDRLAGRSGGLIVKGKGGIPPEPIEPIDSDAIVVDGQFTNPSPQVQSLTIEPVKTSRGDIYPARGVIVTESGEVILTAYPTANIDTRTPYISPNCS